jgi:hypothetical protein
MDTLTLTQIEELLATSKQRGTYKPDIQNFVDSGDLTIEFSALPNYKGKDAQATRNSINNNIEAHAKEADWPALTVLFDRVDPKDKSSWKVILLNMDVFSAAQAAQQDENDDTEV